MERAKKRERALSCHLAKQRVSKSILVKAARFCSELEQTERKTKKKGQCFGLNVKILNIERERQFPIAPAFNLYPNSARGPQGMLGWTWRVGMKTALR